VWSVDYSAGSVDYNFVNLVIGLVSLDGQHRLVFAGIRLLGVEFDVVLVDVNDFFGKARHKKGREVVLPAC